VDEFGRHHRVYLVGPPVRVVYWPSREARLASFTIRVSREPGRCAIERGACEQWAAPGPDHTWSACDGTRDEGAPRKGSVWVPTAGLTVNFKG
jgi:hypothetical protein